MVAEIVTYLKNTLHQAYMIKFSFNFTNIARYFAYCHMLQKNQILQLRLLIFMILLNSLCDIELVCVQQNSWLYCAKMLKGVSTNNQAKL